MTKSLHATRHPLADQNAQLSVLSSWPAFGERLRAAGFEQFEATGITTLQINLGKVCNQTCRHCHVDAGPDRRESMPPDIVEDCLRALAQAGIRTLDITGGAPELHPQFRYLVEQARALGVHVMVRCNLTVLLSNPRFGDLPAFFAGHGVEVVASLPHFSAAHTDAQRGEGVFERSISALRLLNSAGYGDPDTGLLLHLVYNPAGAFLPGSQQGLEREFKASLSRRYGIRFHRLYALTNMPISRYLQYLLDSGQYEAYMQKLVDSFNPAAAAEVMCRQLLSVSWDGYLYDCDFNQMLDLKVAAPISHIRDFVANLLEHRPIVTRNHCYGCTAGAGSSCGGAVA